MQIAIPKFGLRLILCLLLVIGSHANAQAFSKFWQKIVSVDDTFTMWVGCTLSDGTEQAILKFLIGLIPVPIPDEVRKRLTDYGSLSAGEALCFIRHYDPKTKKTIAVKSSHFALKFYKQDGSYIDGADIAGDCGGDKDKPGFCDTTRSEVAAAFIGCFEPRFSGVRSFVITMRLGTVKGITAGMVGPDDKTCEQRRLSANKLIFPR